MNEDATRADAKALGWEITRRSMKPCKACSVGKSKQNNVSKNNDHEPAKGNDEQIFINISSVKEKKDGTPVQSK